jgi:hypothetical protein
MVIIVFHIDECIIGNRNHPFTRVAVYVSKGAHLPHVEIPKSGKVVEYTVSGIIDTLVAADEASVEAPFATTRFHMPSSDENLQLTFIEAKDDTVY